MIKIEHGRILLVIDCYDADLIAWGLSEIIYSKEHFYDDKAVLRATQLADYIDTKISEVKE